MSIACAFGNNLNFHPSSFLSGNILYFFPSCTLSQDFVRKQDRSTGTHLTFLTEGLETAAFKVYFDDWPNIVEPKLYEEGRGKVAGLVCIAP